jgi:hypothetical protein
VNVFLGGSHDAGRGHGVLRLQGPHQFVAIDNEAGCLLRRYLQIEALVLRADDIDLVDVLHQEQTRAHALDVVAQFPMREAVGDYTVDDRVRVAEFIVEGGADDPLRMSSTFLRTWYQMSGTLFGGTLPLRATLIVVRPGTV